MSTLRISLFGKFCILRNKRVLDGFDARKIQELFCYLLLHRDHSLPRETLASLLWPETTTAQSKKNLRQALWQLRSALSSRNECIICCDRAREQTRRHTMRLYYLIGDRTEALRQHKRCAAALEELGGNPSKSAKSYRL